MSLLSEKIAANRELAAQLNELLSHVPLPNGRGSEAPSRTARVAETPPRTALANAPTTDPLLPSRDRKGAVPKKPLPLTPQLHDPRYRNLQEILRRQEADPSLAKYPPLAMKIAARLKLRKLELSRSVEEGLLRRGALWRLFREQLRSASALYDWQRACTSVLLASLRATPMPPEFDEVTYLLLYPDIAEKVAAGDFRSGYEHWMKFGRDEGRLARFHEMAEHESGVLQPRPGIPADFDEDAYLFLNPDVAGAIEKGLFPSGYNHWNSFGRKEGRGGGPWEAVPDRTQYLALLESRPYGINLYGFLNTVSGLGSVARSCVRAIERAEIPLNKISIPSWAEPVAQRSLPEFSPYRVNLLLQNADMLTRFFNAYGTDLLKGAYNIGYWLWELPSARADWHHLYRYVDEVWVASEFCRHAFQTITKLPVTRIPLVVDGLEEKAIYPREHFQLPDDVFVFCCIFDVSSYLDRKNPFCLIEAFKREFGNSRDVLLYLKYFNTKHDEDNVRAIEEAIAGAPNIRTYSGLMEENEIVSLQNSIDCLVSPHRSEGFGYNLAEAMYLGKPVIATRYSSNLDFMRDDNSYLIDCKLIPIPLTVGPYVRGHVWADPSVDHLSHLLRTVFEDRAGRERKGRQAAEDIRREYSATAVGLKIASRLEEIGLPSRDRWPGASSVADLVRGQAEALQVPLAKGAVAATIFKIHGAAGQPRLFAADTPASIADEIRNWASKPVISVITPVYNIEGPYLRRCIESVRAQYYPFWELCLCDDGSTSPDTLEVLESYRGIDPRIKIVVHEMNQGIAAASNRAVEISTGDYLAMLDNDDELAPKALYEVAKAIQANPEIDFLYTDEDKLDDSGEFVDHFCKPDWSPDHLLSVMYILHLLVVRKDLFYEVRGFRPEFSGAQDYDLALRLSMRAQSIHHVPKILYHWRKIRGSAAELVDAKPEALDAGRRALEDHLDRNGIEGEVEFGQIEGTFRVRYRIRDYPLASLCIMASNNRATIEGRGNIDLLENFVKSIVAKTDYPNYEIVVIDDGNLQPLSGVPYRLASFTEPNVPFNFAKKANFAFRQARGRHIVLLNDDMEVISEEWLSAMIEFTQQPRVGVVGARLLFADDRLQHVGVVLGVNRGAAHAFHSFPAGFVGYNAYTHVIRNYSAVTAACMATRIDVVEATGGFDERLAIDYNDIDFCLKAIQQGYDVVYTPYAELYHFEGTSIHRKSQNPQEVELFQQRWASFVERDPFYNPNLTQIRGDFAIDPRASGWPSTGKQFRKRWKPASSRN
jgi:GT2 family glycosyltransferase/glycosyltransferase involved in cell wall biosynthesis